ncbi:MAG: Zn-dependent exopeptidase M28 [Spartobacteria bacterium]|nr:Zn-dependent exopeptidase M28 [Spartobacteria bacterium]
MLFNRREMAYLRAMLNGRKLEFRSPGAGAEWHAVRIFAILLIMNAMALAGIFEFGERPLGTEANRQATEFLAREGERLGYEVERLPFKCVRWEKGPSAIFRGAEQLEVFAGPFSPAIDQWLDGVMVSTTQQLKRTNCKGKIVFLRGEIAKEPLMPLDFPFYFPDAHREIYALLDERQPAAVVAVTAKHPACGLEPYPLIDDANFRIPSAYMDAAALERMLAQKGRIRLRIDSKTFPETGEQLVIRKKAAGASKGKILIFAHMDTAYGTPGALDNAAGVAILLAAMGRLQDYAGPYDLEFIPFNGEDSPMVKGQLAYLERYGKEVGRVKLGINVDAAGAKGSKTAVSTYHLDDERLAWLDGEIAQYSLMERGPEWVESDHSIFVFRGVPCLALTSSTLRESVMALSHTPRDTVDLVDRALLVEAAEFIVRVVTDF